MSRADFMVLHPDAPHSGRDASGARYSSNHTECDTADEALQLAARLPGYVAIRFAATDGDPFQFFVREEQQQMSNVDALAKLLGEVPKFPDYGDDESSPTKQAAEWLAAHGCLVVDSLTDAEAVGVVVDVNYKPEWGDALRAALRRCATGEAEP